MKNKDYAFITILALLAAFIWLRNTDWMSTSDDTLPILVSIPLFVWLEWPWKFLDEEFTVSQPLLSLGVIACMVGVVANLTLLLTIGWTLMMWSWVSKRVDPTQVSMLKKLLVLPMMAFPWIALDAHAIGWWFRLSGAYVTGHLYAFAGFDVVIEGTQILVNNLPISVDVSCAGLNTLQSMLIAGSVLAYIQLNDRPTYWLNIALLAVMAWVANTVRISTLCAAALFVSPAFAMGTFHDLGGWFVLFVMFMVCWLIFSAQQKVVDKVR